MEEYKVKIGMQLDEGASGNLKSQIESITSKKYDIKFDFSSAKSQIVDLKKELTNLGNIKIKIGTTGKVGGANTFSTTTGINQTVNSMESAYKRMLSLQKSIGSLRIRIGGLDSSKNSVEISELNSQLNVLEQCYNRIRTEFGSNISTAQWSKIGEAIISTENKLSQLDAKFADTKAKMATTINSGLSSGEFSKNITNMEAGMSRLSTVTTELQTDFQLLQTSYKNMQVAQASGNQEKLISEYQVYEQTLKRVSNSLTEAMKNQQMYQNAQKLDVAKVNLNNQMSIWLRNNSAAAKEFGSTIKQLQAELQSCDATRFNGIKSEFQVITQQANLAGKATMTFGDSLKEQLSKYTTYLSGAMLITQSFTALKSIYHNVVDIDTAMTELKKVTNETNESYNNFLDNTSGKATEIGSTIKDFITSTSDFARLGYDFVDSQKLAEIANIYYVVGDEIDNIDDATKSVVSTMAAFNIQANDAMSIIDKMNEVGNNYAISSGGIGEALTRSASSMKAANNTLDETIALITAANTVVQDPTSIGTAYKTISMRIRGAKTELEDAGEDTEGMVESTAKLRNEIMALSGVDIMKDNNTFKSTYQILDELSDKWKYLTDIQQASITELIAGKRQGNIVSALMNNFDVARNALETSQNSEGSAMKEHEKWMESIGAKTKQLKANWESLSQTFLNSNFLKGAIDGLSGIVKILDTLMNQLDTIPTLLLVFGSIAGIKSGFFASIPSIIKDLNDLGAAINSIKGLNYISDVASGTIFDIANVNAYREAIQGLSTEQAVFALSSQGLNAQQIQNILITNETIAADVNAALAKVGLTAATAELSQAEMLEIAALNGVTEAEASALLSKLGIVATEEGQVVTKHLVTMAMLEQAVANGTLTAAEAEQIAVMLGLTAAETANVGVTNLLTAAFTKLWAVITAHPIGAILTAVGVVAVGVIKYIKDSNEEAQKAIQEAHDSAQQALDNSKNDLSNSKGELSSVNSELDSTREKIKELGSLKFPTLTEQEELLKLSTANQQLEHQKELLESNIKLKEKGAAYDAKQLLDTQTDYKLSYVLDDVKTKTEDKKGTYEEAGEQIIDNIYNAYGVLNNALDSESETRIQAAQEALDKVKGNSSEYISEILDIIESFKSSDGTIIEGYEDVYKQYMGLINNIQSLADPDAFFTLAESVTKGTNIDYKKEIQKAYDMIYKGDFDISKLNTDFVQKLADNGIDENTIKNIFYNKQKEYERLVNNIDEKYNKKNVNKVSYTTSEMGVNKDGNVYTSSTFDEDGYKTAQKEQKRINKKLKSYSKKNPIEFQLISAYDEDFSILDKYIEEEKEKAINAGIDVANSTDYITNAIDRVYDEAKVQTDNISEMLSDAFTFDLDTETENLSNFFSSIKESISSVGLSTESIDNINKMFSGLKGYDESTLFERTANGIHLNTQELRKLQSQYQKQKKNEIDTQLSTLITAYNDLTTKINECGDATEKANLISQRDEIQNQITSVSDLAAQYKGLTSAFHQWEEAQSAGEEGDMYDSIQGKLKDMKELYKKGLIGTNEFRAAVQLMSNEDLSNASTEELMEIYEEGYPKMKKYFTESSDGCLTFLQDIEKLNSNWVHMNKDGSWDINFGIGDDQNIADALGINVEIVQSIMRKLSDYGFDINLDSMYTSLDLLEADANNAADTLKELGKTKFSFDFDTNDLNTITDEISEAQKIYDTYKKKDGTFKVKAEGYQEAQTVLIQLINRKQQLSKPDIMKVKVDEKSVSDAEKAIGYLQGLQKENNNFELQAAVGADTTEAQKKIQDYAGKIKDLPDEVKTKLGIDSEKFNTALENIKNTKIDVKAGVNLNQEDINIMTTAISAISPEMMVKAGLDSSKIDGYKPEDKTGKITYEITNKAEINSWKPPEKNGVINYKAKVEGSGKAEGTANVNGTAFSQGSWGTKDSGVALVGELGQELLVRNGRYYTIGDDSAEFIKYQKGDIIFNAAQTREIFEKGKITSSSKRGKTYANGTAFSEGNAFSSGSGTLYKKGNVKKTTTDESNKKKKSKKKSKKDKNGKELADTIDWIEVAIERIETAIDNLDRKASSVYNKFSTRNKTLTKEIKKVREEIDLQSKGAKRYEKQAKYVASKTGLSKSWQKKVKDGKIDIDSIKDTKKTSKGYNLKSAIEDYQTWINKAKDCKTAMKELKETVKELYKTAFDNTVTKYEGKLAKFEHKANMINTRISKAESQGYADSTKYYTSLINNEKNNLSTLKTERNALQKKLNDAVKKGKIKKGSEAYNEMKQAIWDVDEAIEQSKADTAEWNAQIRQIKWDRFDALRDSVSKINDESEFLIDLLSNKDLYDDKGQLTNNGMATMGLHSQSYNVNMEQALSYAKERAEIEKQLVKNPYDTKLINRKNELIKLEQESISAAEDEKQAIIDMVEEGINKELEALQKLIDTYTDALDAQKDLYDYQKKISSQSKDIAKIQKQLSAYANDNSEESKAKIQELKESLSQAQEDLEETQYDQYITDQKNLLNNLYDEYEGILNQRLDNVDQLIQDMINTVNNNSSTINKTIKEAANNVGYTLTEAITTVWKSSNAVTNYDGDTNKNTNTKTAVNNNISEMNTAFAKADSNASSSSSKKYSKTIKEKIEKVFDNSKYYAKGKKKKASDYSTSINQFLFKKNGKVLSSDGLKQIRSILGLSSNSKILDELKYISKTYGNIKNVGGFKTGTYNLGSNRLAWTQEGYNPEVIIRPSDGAILTPLAKGDSVLNANATANLWDMANNPAQFIKDNLLAETSTSIPNVISNGNNNTIKNNIEMILTLPNVKNYEDFVRALQNDPRFEEMVQDMSVNLLAGGSSLSKYRHKF